MKNYANEIKVGGTLALATILLATGFRFMRDLPILHPDQTFYIQFPQVTGLATGRSVFWNGVDVGKVQKINLLPNDSVNVQLTIKAKYDIPEGSRATLRAADMLGTMIIELVRGPGPGIMEDYSTLPGEVAPDALGKLMETGSGITGELSGTIYKLNSILGEMDEVVTGTGGKNLEEILAGASDATTALGTTLKKKQSDIEKTITHLEKLTSSAEAITSGNKQKLNAIISNLEKSSAELETMTKSVNAVSSELNTLLKKINKGEGTLGKMANDPSLYNHADSVMVNLNALLKDVKENPKKYTKGLVGL